jgi:hypothetical protein
MKRNPILVGAVAAAVLVVAGAVVANRILGKGASEPPSNSQQTGASQETGPRITVVTATPIAEREVPGRGKAAVEIEIVGERFFGTALGPFVRFDGAEAVAVILDSDTKITALASPGLHGRVQVQVENPDHRTATSSVTIP